MISLEFYPMSYLVTNFPHYGKVDVMYIFLSENDVVLLILTSEVILKYVYDFSLSVIL
jgi:hypothetical protein